MSRQRVSLGVDFAKDQDMKQNIGDVSHQFPNQQEGKAVETLLQEIRRTHPVIRSCFGMKITLENLASSLNHLKKKYQHEDFFWKEIPESSEIWE